MTHASDSSLSTKYELKTSKDYSRYSAASQSVQLSSWKFDARLKDEQRSDSVGHSLLYVGTERKIMQKRR